MFAKSFKQDATITPQSGIIDGGAATGGIVIPSGTTAQRPNNPKVGTQRWNTDTTSMEVYVGGGTGWQTIASTAYSIDYLVIAGGGGGGGYNGSGGAGGTGGGGQGGNGSTSVNGGNGSTNSGGGAGGGYYGGTGGSGLVIIRYLSNSQRGTGGTVTISSGYYYHTFTASGTYIA